MTTLRFHPIADIFPLMENPEFQNLVADIREHGLIDPITLHLDGSILDGRNRYRACIEAGVEPVFETWGGPNGAETSFVISRNIHRRHLTHDQKREMIAALLKATPERSNRQIARDVKVDDKTVGTVRKAMEATAEIPQLDKTTGEDGKARPAKRTLPHSREWYTQRRRLERFQAVMGMLGGFAGIDPEMFHLPKLDPDQVAPEIEELKKAEKWIRAFRRRLEELEKTEVAGDVDAEGTPA